MRICRTFRMCNHFATMALMVASCLATFAHATVHYNRRPSGALERPGTWETPVAANSNHGYRTKGDGEQLDTQIPPGYVIHSLGPQRMYAVEKSINDKLAAQDLFETKPEAGEDLVAAGGKHGKKKKKKKKKKKGKKHHGGSSSSSSGGGGHGGSSSSSSGGGGGGSSSSSGGGPSSSSSSSGGPSSSSSSSG